MDIKANAILNSTGDGPVEFTNGTSVSGLVTTTNINFTGVSTAGNIQATAVSVSNINAVLVGSGASLSGMSPVASGRVVGLKFILADPPLRA